MSIFVCGDIHSTLDIDKLNELKSREDLDKNDSFSKLQIVWILRTGISGIFMKKCFYSERKEQI